MLVSITDIDKGRPRRNRAIRRDFTAVLWSRYNYSLASSPASHWFVLLPRAVVVVANFRFGRGLLADLALFGL